MQSIQTLIKNSNTQTQSSLEKRKADTRRKIMLGGLIIKAKLDYLYPEHVQVLYGMLLDGKNALKSKPKLLDKWQLLGEEFNNTKEK